MHVLDEIDNIGYERRWEHYCGLKMNIKSCRLELCIAVSAC